MIINITSKKWIIILGISLLSHSIYAVDLIKVGMFGAGFASGTIFHELGHATFGIMNGGKLESIQFQETRFSGIPSSEAAQWMILGGYAFQTVASEIILQNQAWHTNDFALGWMSLGIYTNLSNPIRYYIFGETNNDLGNYKKAGGEPAIPAFLMATYSLISLYRIFNETKIPVYVGSL